MKMANACKKYSVQIYLPLPKKCVRGEGSGLQHPPRPLPGSRQPLSSTDWRERVRYGETRKFKKWTSGAFAHLRLCLETLLLNHEKGI